MRWNKVAVLKKIVMLPNDEGVPIEHVASEAVVFANPRHMGTEAWVAARSIGLHADSTIQVRSIEYSGENRCIVDDVEYEIERVYDMGEYSTLTLKRRLRNG